MTGESSNIFASAIAIIGSMIAGFYAHLAPWLLLGAALVMVDLRFGLLAAKRRGEDIRPSRACRRTVNKMIDYLCWVTLAELCTRTFGITLGAPVVSMAMLFVIYGIELNSCVNNYLEYKGINKKWNFFRLTNKENLLDDKEEKIVKEGDTEI